MKKLLPFLLLLLRIQPASAQAPVIDTSWLPRAGTFYQPLSFEFSALDQYNPWADDTGPDHLWNLGWFGHTMLEPFALDHPSKLGIRPKDADSANLASGRDTFYVCYHTDVNGYGIVEMRISFDDFFTYEDRELILPIPLTFGDSVTDSTNYHYYNHSLDTDCFRAVRKVFYYDGYGTLMVQGQRFENVVRIKVKETFKDSFLSEKAGGRGPSGWHHWLGDYEYYEWFNQENGLSILRLGMFASYSPIYSNGQFSHYSASGSKRGSMRVRIESIYQPPPPIQWTNVSAYMTGGNIIIKNEGNLENHVVYRLYDFLGRQLLFGEKPLLPNSSISIEVPHLAKGVYILRMATEGEAYKTLMLPNR